MISLHRVKFGDILSVTPEFKRVVGVHPSPFWKKILWDELLQQLLDRFSPNFHRMVGIWS